jgi:uncharacterized protein YbjT (DUF2867 family)
VLRDTMLAEQPHDSSAGTEAVRVLVEAHSFIHTHFWLTVNFPAIAPGTPSGVKIRAVARNAERLVPLTTKGVEARVGDIENAASLTKAFLGADAVFAMIPPHNNVPDNRADQRRIAARLVEAIDMRRGRPSQNGS